MAYCHFESHFISQLKEIAALEDSKWNTGLNYLASSIKSFSEIGLSLSRLQSTSMQKDLGVWVDGKLNVGQQGPGSQDSQLWAGEIWAQHGQAGKGDCPTLLSSAMAPPQVLCAVLDISIYERHQTIRVCTEESWGQDFGVVAEVSWLAQPGEGSRMALWQSAPDSREGGADLCLGTIDRTQGNRMNLCQRKLRLGIRKRFFTGTLASHWFRLPREMVMAQPVGVQGALQCCSFLAIWFNLKLSGSWSQRSLWLPSNLTHSVILRFVEFFIKWHFSVARLWESSELYFILKKILHYREYNYEMMNDYFHKHMLCIFSKRFVQGVW